jgi:hypothetical protein
VGFRLHLGQRALRWLNGGSYWRWSVPAVAILAVFVLVASSISEQKRTQSESTTTSAVSARADVSPVQTYETLSQPAAQPTPSVSAFAPAPPPTNRRNCDAIRGTPYQSEDERTWFLANCLGTPTPVRLDAPVYLSRVVDITTSYSAEMNTFTGLLDRGSRNPSLILDTSWVRSLNQSLAKMRNYGMQMRALKPPVCTQTAHGQLISAVDEVDIAFDFVSSGVDSIDANTLLRAVPHMHQGTAYLKQATAGLKGARC